jgi:hypothetical protein
MRIVSIQLLAVLTGSALLCVAVLLVGAPAQPITVKERVTIKTPSDLLARGGKGTTPYSLDFVLWRVRDLRLMYCDLETLQRRERDGVCVIDYASPTEPVELQVSQDATLGDVLNQLGLEKWKGFGPPGIYVIKARAILAHNHSETFLETEISPGDFIVILPVY